MRDFKNIKAFQLADSVAVKIYELTKNFPKEEIYGLTSQIRRAAVSVPTNIAEGASRQHKKEYLHFLFISRSSLAETQYLIHLSTRLGYISEEQYLVLEENLNETAKTLYGLIKVVKKEAGIINVIFAFLSSSLIYYLSKGSYSL